MQSISLLGFSFLKAAQTKRVSPILLAHGMTIFAFSFHGTEFLFPFHINLSMCVAISNYFWEGSGNAPLLPSWMLLHSQVSVRGGGHFRDLNVTGVGDGFPASLWPVFFGIDSLVCTGATGKLCFLAKGFLEFLDYNRLKPSVEHAINC